MSLIAASGPDWMNFGAILVFIGCAGMGFAIAFGTKGGRLSLKPGSADRAMGLILVTVGVVLAYLMAR